MPINTNLPVAGVSNHKVTLSADLQTVLFVGQEIPTAHFIAVTVPSLLGFYAPGTAGSNALLSELAANGFNIRAFSKHTDAWAHAIQSNREEQARRAREVQEHRERIAALYATPEEIRKEAAEKRARDERIAKQFGRKYQAFGDL